MIALFFNGAIFLLAYECKAKYQKGNSLVPGCMATINIVVSLTCTGVLFSANQY